MSVELRVRGLRAGYGPVEVLHGVDLDVPAGRVTALVGRNGAGKTTLLRTIAGLLPATGGTIHHRDSDITHRPAYRRARAGVLLVPDDRGVFADLSVEDNLRLFAPDGAALATAAEAFPVLGRRRRQLAGTLSGGEQQMLALSRVLVRPAGVVLVDELSRGLAGPVITQLYRVLVDRAAETGTAIVLAEPDAAAVLPLAHIAYVLSRGTVIFAGEPADLPDGGGAQPLSSSSGTS
jgi:branched-chain amino acid transport system ATP-binding protein